MDIREIFAGRIIDLRNKRGLTQAEVAQSIGISRQSVTLYESQQRVPDIAVLRKFSEFFGVTSDYLIGLSDNKNAENVATGHELGLSDKAIENLKANQKILNEINQLDGEESLAFMECLGLEYDRERMEKFSKEYRDTMPSLNSISRDQLDEWEKTDGIHYMTPTETLTWYEKNFEYIEERLEAIKLKYPKIKRRTRRAYARAS